MFLVYLHPREKIRDNGMLPDYCIFKSFFMSFSHITQILSKLGNLDLSNIVGFFILHKMKKKIIWQHAVIPNFPPGVQIYQKHILSPVHL